MVESLTRDYFNSYFGNALFDYNGKVHRILEAGRYGVLCRNIEDRTDVTLENDTFKGFKTFAYPVLGYRRMKENVVAYLIRKQSTQRGLRFNSFETSYSPCTQALEAMGLVNPRSDEDSRSLAAFRQTFDTLDDMPKLLKGELAQLVLSPFILIEPSVAADADWYSVFYKRSLVGKMDNKGNVEWNDPSFSNLLQR